MALASTQPLTEMSTRDVSCGKDGWCVGLTSLPPSCADCLEMWESHPPGTQGLSRPVMGLLYLYLYIEHKYLDPAPRQTVVATNASLPVVTRNLTPVVMRVDRKIT
jgi:hypothetical protein